VPHPERSEGWGIYFSPVDSDLEQEKAGPSIACSRRFAQDDNALKVSTTVILEVSMTRAEYPVEAV
jgi:hypothetical protein